MHCRGIFKQSGWSFVCDINAKSLEQFQQDYPKLHIYTCDLADHEQIKLMFSQAIQKLGGIDILVNNTGISGPTVAADELSFEGGTRWLI